MNHAEKAALAEALLIIGASAGCNCKRHTLPIAKRFLRVSLDSELFLAAAGFRDAVEFIEAMPEDEGVPERTHDDR